MAADYKAVANFANASPSIGSTAVIPQASIWRVRTFRSNNATSKMLALMLAHQQPVDLLTGQRINIGKSLAWNNDKEFHHLFPRAYVKKNSTIDANSLANIAMLTSASNISISAKAPSGYLDQLRKRIGDDEFYRRLELSLVPREAVEAALHDNFDQFLQLRSEVLQHTAMALIGANTQGAPELVESSALAQDYQDDEDEDLVDE